MSTINIASRVLPQVPYSSAYSSASSFALAGKPARANRNPVTDLVDPKGTSGNGKTAVDDFLNPRTSQKKDGANQIRPATTSDAEFKRNLEGVGKTINPQPAKNTEYERNEKAKLNAATAQAIDKSIKPRTLQLEGDRRVFLRVRNNGKLVIDFPDQFNLGSKKVSLDVPNVNKKSSSADISKAVKLLCSNNRTVPYVFDNAGRPVSNDGGRQAEIERRQASSNSTANMSGTDKLMYVLDVAMKNATPAVAAELKALFTPENMVKMAVLGGVQFIPGVGIAADVVVGLVAGQQAIDVGIKYFDAIYTALNATTKDELESSGVAIAQATAQLGVGVGSTLVGAGIAKGLRNSARASAQSKPTSGAFGSESKRPGGAKIRPTDKSPGPKTPNLGATLKAAQNATDALVTGGTLAGLAYLKAKIDRGEVAIGYADKLPGMKNAITSIFNDASSDNSVAGAQGQVVLYTTKPGSKEADGYFLANINASVAGSKFLNIANITKDLKTGQLNPAGWVDFGKVNLIAQNLAKKDQTGGGARVTLGSLASANAGIYFGVPELNTRYKASVNLMSMNGTVRGMAIGANGKQDASSKIAAAKGLFQAYLNFYSVIPTQQDVLDAQGQPTGEKKRIAKSPSFLNAQLQLNQQLGLPGGMATQISNVQPRKLEGNVYVGATDRDGNKRAAVGQANGLGESASTQAFSFLLNGNKNSKLSAGDIVKMTYSDESRTKVAGELSSQFDGFTAAMKQAFMDPYPVGSPGYLREKNRNQQIPLSPY